MAAVMTSCNNDETDYIMQPAPTDNTVQNVDAQEKMDVSLVVAVTPERARSHTEGPARSFWLDTNVRLSALRVYFNLDIPQIILERIT